jgi:hypothetical protein
VLQKEQVHPIGKDVFQKWEDEGLEVSNLFKVLAHSPKIGCDVRRIDVSILYKSKLLPKSAGVSYPSSWYSGECDI